MPITTSGGALGRQRVSRGVGWWSRLHPATGAAATTTPDPPGQAHG